MSIAVLGDRHSFHQVHHEELSTVRRLAAIENAGDVRVVHQSQGLRIGFNRANTAFEFIPGLMSLIATIRLTGSNCRAIHTLPIPPSPISSRSVYRLMSVMPASVWGTCGPVDGSEPEVGGPSRATSMYAGSAWAAGVAPLPTAVRRSIHTLPQGMPCVRPPATQPP